MIEQEDVERLGEIRTEIAELIDEAKQILRGADRDVRERAERGWIAEIEVAVGGEHEWLARSSHSMLETIQELRKAEAEAGEGDGDVEEALREIAGEASAT